ncbi:hypothetical protein NI389_02215 [Pseudoalteromonas xiamenensis]|uniref:hypothetical protein n=1 Tax=Pseudoalteromonas xiamenensis TaxID=882626 RepID=UPI0027E4A437|nr:hypothetical protein [Pseudoalteromonas xiamenensis]WMN60263.1 hypothetical protein NI389_02215 [Pseudoalteromonas xiamenensis]
MTMLVLVTLILLIVLLAVYVVIENNRRKAREAEKRAYNERVKEINAHFKLKLAEFVEAKIVRPKYVPKLQSITNNFFVVQHHTEENLHQLERVADLFVNTVGRELQKCYVTKNIDALETQMQYFVAELPSAGIAYNKAFYHEILPALIVLLQTPDQPDGITEEESVLEDEAQIQDKQDDEPEFIAPKTKAQELSNY